MFCRTCSTKIRKFIIGSFVRIIQWCNNCKTKRVWESQPYLGNIPAGNILTSAAILYTGALPSQALRIFSFLNCCTINRDSFFRHHREFLQPTIEYLWNKQQQALLSRFKESSTPLAVAGDGRADSPGHSAKYGSYTFIEMTCNKVVDFKGARSRLRARALFRILAAYTIIILDNHGVEIKLQRAAIQ